MTTVLYTHPEQDAFIAGVVEEESSVADLKDTLPPQWNGKYQGHFFKFDNTLSMGTDASERGVTHLALLEGPMGAGDGVHYFDGDTITHNAVVLQFNETKQQYENFHCRSCAMAVLNWMTEMQEQWAKNPKPASLVA